MKYLQKPLAIVVVWAGIVTLTYLFHLWKMLNGVGAFWLVVAALMVTGIIWEGDNKSPKK